MLTFAQLWNTQYQVEHRRFQVLTEDGVRIAGVHLDRVDSETLIIYIHGFMSGKNHLRVPNFVEALAAYFDVMAVDLRGHGESDGGSTMGAQEVLDIQATVEYARSLGYQRIVTVASSMGGAATIRHAARYKSQDGVVTIGAFANVMDIGRPKADLGLQFLYRTGRVGEVWSYLTRGTRLDYLERHEAPYEVVGQIAPIPLLLMHGEWDTTVHPRSAKLLYAHAGEPKELILIPRGGHDYPHLTRQTAERIREWMGRYGLLAPKDREKLAAEPPLLDDEAV